METLQKSKYSEIQELLISGIDCWKKAGDLLCAFLDKGESIVVISEETGMPRNVLVQLERIGRKQIMPFLLISDFPAARALEKLPYSEQKRLTEESVPVLLQTAEGPDILNVKVEAMTHEQVRQVFGDGQVRSIAEQKARIAVCRNPMPPRPVIHLLEPSRFQRWLKTVESEIGRAAGGVELDCYKRAWNAAIGGRA